MHKPVFEDRFEYTKGGELVLITNARGRAFDKERRLRLQDSFDCVKTFESGRQVCRNLYINQFYGGYYVEFPKDHLKYWDSKKKELVTDKRGYDYYCNCKVNVPSFGFNNSDAEIIYRKYPDFKYVVNKWKGYKTKRQVLEILKVWKEHKGVELPLSFGYERVCFNKQFLSLKKDKLKTVAKFMSENPDKDYCWTDLRAMLKYGVETVKQRKHCVSLMGKDVSMEFAKWATLQLPNFEYEYKFADMYQRYEEKCRYLGKDMKDPYWKYPGNLIKRYRKVEEQYNNVVHMREMEKAKKQIESYLERTKKFEGVDKRIGRYNIFIPRSVEEWNKQADKLHQCIVRMNYIDKCNDNYILVFIYKDGEPLATCEITNVAEKKMGQFYCDEEDRSRMYPDEQTKKLMHTWLDELQVA